MGGNEERLRDVLRVALVPGVGPLTYRALLSRFRTAAAVCRASLSDLLSVPRVGRRVATALQRNQLGSLVDELLAVCRRESVQVLLEDSQHYPPLLLQIPDPPPVLFVRGELNPADRKCVALVGSRSATDYGRRMADRLARDLAASGVTVVSGLARGIDAASHRGALAANGRTVAMLGGGVANIYPPEHVKLAEQIATNGALISESPPHQPPRSGSFPRRNRLISGMSLAVVVVEASCRSGALISARHALEQGREVMAVPGRIDTPTAAGCNRLLKDGAKLVERLEDILEELESLADVAQPENSGAPPCSAAVAPSPRNQAAIDRLCGVEKQVFQRLSEDEATIDEVIAHCDQTPAAVLAAVSSLEMQRLIRRIGGARIARR